MHINTKRYGRFDRLCCVCYVILVMPEPASGGIGRTELAGTQLPCCPRDFLLDINFRSFRSQFVFFA